MIRIVVTRTAENELSQQEWTFWFRDTDCTFYVDMYRIQQRPSRRHKFATLRVYHRCDQRSNTIKVDEVPLPPDVVEECKSEMAKKLTVKKWQN